MQINANDIRMPQMNKNKIVYPELSYKIYGLCFYTQNRLGRYRNEKQYGDFLEKLFKETGLEYKREKQLPASFDGEGARRNIPDFIL